MRWRRTCRIPPARKVPPHCATVSAATAATAARCVGCLRTTSCACAMPMGPTSSPTCVRCPWHRSPCPPRRSRCTYGGAWPAAPMPLSRPTCTACRRCSARPMPISVWRTACVARWAPYGEHLVMTICTERHDLGLRADTPWPDESPSDLAVVRAYDEAALRRLVRKGVALCGRELRPVGRGPWPMAHGPWPLGPLHRRGSRRCPRVSQQRERARHRSAQALSAQPMDSTCRLC